MKRMLATGMISAIVLAVAPAAWAVPEPVNVCAYVHVRVNGEDVVNESKCQQVVQTVMYGEH